MKRLEYIQSTGTQSIDTGYKPNGNTKVYIKFKIVEQTISFPKIFGASNGSDTFFMQDNRPNPTTLSLGLSYYKNSDPYRILSDTLEDTIFECECDNNFIVNNQIIGKREKQVFGINYNMHIFANNRAGTISQYAKIKLYSFKIFTNKNLINYFIPVEDDDGVACMFDLVTGEYFYNQGTGEFTKGPRLDVYTPIEYLESTGTQYIDTGYTYSTGYKLELDTEFTEDASGIKTLFGSNSSSNTEVLLGFRNMTTNYLGGKFTYTWTKNTRYDILLDFKNSTQTFLKLFVNNNLVRQIENQNVNNKEIYIFGSQKTSTDSVANVFIAEKLYSFKIWYYDELVQYLIPVLDKNDVPCLYDLVSKTYFYNQGTGNFIGGDVMPMAVADTAGLQQIANNIKGALNTKQNTLTQGTNITITNDVIDVDAVEISNSEIDALFT